MTIALDLIENDDANGYRLYWSGPYPQNTVALGTVTRDGCDTGVLFFNLHTRIYTQGNAGAVRSLPQSEVRDARVAAHNRTHNADAAKAFFGSAYKPFDAR